MFFITYYKCYTEVFNIYKLKTTEMQIYMPSTYYVGMVNKSNVYYGTKGDYFISFLKITWFPPPIKLTAMVKLQYCLKSVILYPYLFYF
jgi:hypothetical protein